MLKKRIGLLVFAMLFVFTSAAQAASAKTPAQIHVLLDGKQIQFQAAPVMKDSVTFVQFRPLFQALGYEVNWNSSTQQVLGTFADQKLEMKIGSTIAYVNGQKTNLAIAPYTNAGNTLVPLRFVAESTGLPVKWDAKASTIQIDRKTVTDQVAAEIIQLYSQQSAAVSNGDYKAALTALHPNSLNYQDYEQSYKVMSSSKGKLKAYVDNVTVAGSSVVATVAKNYERTGGAFKWDNTVYYEVILKKDDTGAWKEYVVYQLDLEFHLQKGLLDGKPEVPEAERTALLDTLQTYYKGLNEKNEKLLFSTISADSPYDEALNSWINEENVFNEHNFNMQANSSRIVLYQNNEALIYVEETDDADGDTYTSYSLYWLKKQNAKWLIYDVLEIAE